MTDERPLEIGLVSISDRASQGVYVDQGVPGLTSWFEAALATPFHFETRLIPDEQAIIERIKQGKTNQMPAWRGKFTEAQIHVLTAYVWGLSNPAGQAGEAAEGGMVDAEPATATGGDDAQAAAAPVSGSTEDARGE